MGDGRFYVTTPIYYVNDEPHIGHAYTTVLADVLARFHRLRGDATRFLTGTDEHGQKIVEASAQAGRTPREHCDLMAARFREAWQVLQISNDDFIRTTEPRHQRVVQRILAELHRRGEIYQDTYEGLYCVPDERFWTEKDVVGGNCPDCGRPVVPLSETNYFFRMSRYQDWLIRHIEDHPEFIRPTSRRNEVLGFLKKPLGDLCISRPASRLGWGIPLPFDPAYVTYVWFDALVNYYSAVDGVEAPDHGNWWPATCHLIAKDILTTHAVYWPTMLRAAGLEPPQAILAHGWWTHAGRKMSKSLGNVVHPMEMCRAHGVDGFRFFLMRDMVVGLDSDFSEPALVARINSDLANDLGNCLNRIERMIHAHFADRVPEPGPRDAADEGLAHQARLAVDSVLVAMEEARIHSAIEETLELVRAVNRYLEVKAPWKAVKSGGPEAIASTLATAAEAIRLSVSLLAPIMPGKCGEALFRLGMIEAPDALLKGAADPAWIRWGGLRPGTPIRPGGALFPRIETAPPQADPGRAGGAR